MWSVWSRSSCCARIAVHAFPGGNDLLRQLGCHLNPIAPSACQSVPDEWLALPRLPELWSVIKPRRVHVGDTHFDRIAEQLCRSIRVNTVRSAHGGQPHAAEAQGGHLDPCAPKSTIEHRKPLLPPQKAETLDSLTHDFGNGGLYPRNCVACCVPQFSRAAAPVSLYAISILRINL